MNFSSFYLLVVNFEKNSITNLIYGQAIRGSFNNLIGVGGMVVTLVALIGLAILMTFGLSGTSNTHLKEVILEA